MLEEMIRLGGLCNISLVVFHLMFWRLFDWQQDLRSLSWVNRAIMQVMNLSLILIFLIFGYLSLGYPRELLDSELGQRLLLLMALFWFARAMQQILFFQLKHWISQVFLLVFLGIALLYAIPAGSVLRPLWN